MKILGPLLLWLSSALSVYVQAAGNEWLEQPTEFLPVAEAFVLEGQISPTNVLKARWRMADGYYLYRHQLKFQLAAGDSGAVLAMPSIPDGIEKFDEFFGDVEVYYGQVEVSVPVVGEIPEGATVTIGYQGCADLGLCYPPQLALFNVNAGGFLEGPLSADEVDVLTRLDNVNSEGPAATPSPALTEDQSLASVLAEQSLWTSIAIFFVAGIGLAFTPCVFPMVPILSTIIVGEGASLSRSRAFSLSLAYVLGMSLTYALVGTLVGLFGAELNLQAKLQSPLVLSVFAAVFVWLAGSMFGFYELALPQSIQQWVDERSAKQRGGRHPSVFVMGALSSLVVSPCISAPLAGALIYLSNTADVVLGGSALLALGLGMGVPLLIVGGSGGHWLPRAGAWMNAVRAAFGIGLLGVAIWLLERLLPGALVLALWAGLFIGTGVAMGALNFSPSGNMARIGQVAGLMLGLWGVACLAGASAGGTDVYRPLAAFTEGNADGSAVHENQWLAVKSLDDVQRQVAASSQPVILDLYADWCISCKVMERGVFPKPPVAERLAQFRLLRADVTANDEIDRELLSHYGLFGPPSLVFLNSEGNEFKGYRIQGEITADAMATHLQTFLDSPQRL